MKSSLLTLLGICLILASTAATCQCRHFDEKLPPGTIDDRDFLHPLGLMTLDCLKFRGIAKHGKKLIALLQDDRGKSYRVSRGEPIGENDGRLDEITPSRLTITQLVPDGDGGWVEQRRYMLRNQ